MRYIASFEPQAWVKDYAVAVDSEGETTWDCTNSIANGGLNKSKVDAEIKRAGYFLDRDDYLKGDEKAPKWVKDWQGPFTITVTRQG